MGLSDLIKEIQGPISLFVLPCEDTAFLPSSTILEVKNWPLTDTKCWKFDLGSVARTVRNKFVNC
jgi:hypothetical protein